MSKLTTNAFGYDITYCSREDCKQHDCYRHMDHCPPPEEKPCFSIANFADCKDYEIDTRRNRRR